MAKLMSLTHKPTTSVALFVILMFFLPLFLYSWNLMVATSLRLWILIKRPPFIYVVFNFIIVYILLSSTFSLNLKFFKKPKSPPPPSPNPQPKTTLKQIHTASYSSLEGDRDTWWGQIVDGVDREKRETASSEVRNVEEIETVPFKLAEKIVDGEEAWIETASSEEVKRRVEEEGGEGDDSLDATWEAIMEAKRKGSGPQLKKSDTWSAGNKKGRLGREKIAAELKKWRTFKGAVEDNVSSRGGGGWRRMEAVVTDHDELKKRSEAFISRFTHDIRLQRLESDQRFLEIINRGL